MSPVDSVFLPDLVADIERGSDQPEYHRVDYDQIPLKTIDLHNLDIALFEALDPLLMRSPMDNSSFIEGLEAMNRDLDKAAERNEMRYRLGEETAIGISMSISAGIVNWVLRGGSLLASFMSVMPLWKQFDPLPIIGMEGLPKNRDESKQKTAEDEHDEKVEALFTE